MNFRPVQSSLGFNEGCPRLPHLLQKHYMFDIQINTVKPLWPPQLSAFLRSCMYILNTNTAHIIPTSLQYSDHCLGVGC